MSLRPQIDRLQKNISGSLQAVEKKGVFIPNGSNSDNLPNLISQIKTVTELENAEDISV